MKKKIAILILLIITLISLVLYYTLATDITMKETTGEADLTYNIDINDTDGRTITVEAGKTKVFDIMITNRNGGSIKYGLAYKANTSTDIKVKKLDTSTNDVTGIIENNATLQVSLVIDNKSTDNLTYNIVPITGYVKGGDLMVPSGYIMVSEVHSFPKARTSDEMLQYLGLTAKTGTPDFSKTATTDEGIYVAEDDYGKSYYFRGVVTNNYVKFANKWWRIIRINGDGTIRMIYDGTTAHNNGEISSDREITASTFNGSYNRNAYVGYMYGTPSSSTYTNEHTNTNNSTIKGVVDNWYKTNIVDNGYSDKIADVIFCNDRQLNYGTGIGMEDTDYEAYSRISSNAPKLTCSQKNDRFTVEDTTKGNRALTYPVGLITADEVSMAGTTWYASSNTSFYLYTGSAYFTMSPGYFDYNNANEFYVGSDGALSIHSVGNIRGVRPVISLKNNLQLSGTGTMLDPFVVQ